MGNAIFSMSAFILCIKSQSIQGRTVPFPKSINSGQQHGKSSRQKPKSGLKRLLLTSFRSMPSANSKRAFSTTRTAIYSMSWRPLLYMKIPPISEVQQKQLNKIWKANSPWIDWSVAMLVLGKPKWQSVLPLRPWTTASKSLFLFPPRSLPFSITTPFQSDCTIFPCKSIISTAFGRPKTERKFSMG